MANRRPERMFSVKSSQQDGLFAISSVNSLSRAILSYTLPIDTTPLILVALSFRLKNTSRQVKVMNLGSLQLKPHFMPQMFKFLIQSLVRFQNYGGNLAKWELDI
ncbi:uncharacterized protein LOC110652704 [Hevea brasiliensis]|uniref:uncharacterized protein LOC110652704 n=1 Tax=Hevea brasiliensis TaxID=3981 RepID=UPI0025F0973A|nr:uncharacterized protein LOC110652704 [Hevea brasiliensis]